MIESLYFKQPKPITVRILGIVLLLFTLYISYAGTPPLSQIISMATIGLLLVGYSISYEIKSDFNNKTHYKFFGITVFIQRLAIIFPDYITVFSARFKQSSDWGPVAAMGKETDNETFVIRFFKGNRHFTVFKTNSLKLANTEAEKLGLLLNVEIKGKK